VVSEKRTEGRPEPLPAPAPTARLGGTVHLDAE
jgi:hypothetical protein